MFFRRKQGTETYTTSDWDDDKADTPPSDPVIALLELPNGPTHVLADIQNSYGPKKWISIGSGSVCDIRFLEEPGQGTTVSREHSELCRTPQGRWLIRRHPNAHNNTKVNRTRIRDFAELSPGDIVRAGKIEVLVLSASGLDRMKITADNPDDYVERVCKARGSAQAAAPVWGVNRSTVARWLRKIRS